MDGITREFAAVVIDVNDFERESEFWGAVIGEEPGLIGNDVGWLTAGRMAYRQSALTASTHASIVSSAAPAAYGVVFTS
jgi:hypothetical protein